MDIQTKMVPFEDGIERQAYVVVLDGGAEVRVEKQLADAYRYGWEAFVIKEVERAQRRS